MARHGESKHFKRSVVTRAVVIPRKKYKYYIRPFPGKHKNSEGIALLGVLRDVMKVANNSKEASYLISEGHVMVDEKIVREDKYNVGFGDLIDINGEKFKVEINDKGKLVVANDDSDHKVKQLKIMSQGKFKGGKTVLRMNDGRNIISDRNDIQIGDTVTLNLKNNTIEKTIPFEQGRQAIVFRGKNAGRIGKIIKIDGDNVELEKEGSSFIVSARSCFVL
jgi:small subunit ribosomal protein S4e